MKHIVISVLASALFLTACNSAKQASNGHNYDDIYYSGKTKPAAPPVTSNPDNYTAEPQPATQEEASRFDYANNNGTNPVTTSTQGGGNTYITNNYYNNDDYYDYAYSSRIRRFYYPVGYNYYAPYYTNSYWYDYNPYSWGISIYSTYGWWAPAVYYSYNPYYGSGWSLSIGYYGGWNPYCYRPYYYPYGYNPYCPSCCNSCCNTCGGYGYWGGYYTGLYGNSYSPYYYNSYDNNTHYYGNHRKTTGASGAGTPNYGPDRNSTLDHNLANVYATTVPAPVNSSVHGGGTLPSGNSSFTNSDIKGSGNTIKNNANSSGDINGGVKPVYGNEPVKNTYNSGDIKSGTGNNGDIKSGTNSGDIRNNSGNVNSYSSQPGVSGDVKSNTPGGIRNNGGNTNTYTQPAGGNIKGGIDPRDGGANGAPADIRNNYSNPRNDNYVSPNNGDIRQPYSNPRNNYEAPANNDVRNNNGNIKNDARDVNESGKSKWNSIFNGGTGNPNSGNNDYNNSDKRNDYREPSRSKDSDNSKSKYNTPRQNSSPSYTPRNTPSSPSPKQDVKSAPARDSKKGR